MALDDKTRTAEVPAGQLDNGIEPAGSNIAAEFYFSDSIVNIHKAQYDGFGPRYGMAPVPYHACNFGLSSYNLVSMEGSGGTQADLRRLLFGIVPLRLSAYSDTGPLGASQTYYAWVGTGISASVPEIIIEDGMIAGSTRTPRAYLDVSLSRYTNWRDAPLSSSGEWVYFLSGIPTDSTRRLLGTWTNSFASVASLTVPGRVVKMEWYVGTITTQATGSVPPIVTLKFFGYGSEFAYLNQTPGSRVLSVFILRTRTATGQQTTRTSYSTSATGPYYLYRNNYVKSAADVDATKLTYSGTTDYGVGVSGDYGVATLALYRDSAAVHNQRHTVVASAFGKPYGWVYKEEMNSTLSAGGVSQTLPMIPIDFTRFRYTPNDLATRNQNTINQYTENGSAKNTCWSAWPSFVDTTPTANDVTLSSGAIGNNVAIGAADSGILRSETIYEFAYAIYNKLIGHETNVGTPAKILTGTDDFVCLYLRRSTTDTGASTGANLAATVGGNGPFASLEFQNLFEFRVYYREFGTFEWLPAGRFDAVNYFFNSSERTLGVCQGAIAGLPGGQPGGFIDNSNLPDDEYFQTFTFNKRLFWFSPKSVVFSYQDNPYCYPVTNAFGCPDGAFLGAIAHAYPGQAEQGARIVIFSTKQTYTARFLGEQFATQQPVRVSPDFVSTFPLDGSDFQIEPWTSITAFSYRSAVNAKGVLYWWGPEGIFRDDGVNVPGKEWCEYMDPYLKDLYDKTQTQRIHAVYNTNTHEVIWFYIDAAGVQKALVYNTKADSFFNWSFANILIDAAQILDVQLIPTTDITRRAGIQGSRITLMCRDASDPDGPQRAVFFDELVDGGDLRIYRIAMCTAVAIAGANRRLSLTVSNAGYVLPTSGKATVSNYNQYTDPNVLRDADGIYTIVGGDGATYIDISPIGAWPAVGFAIGAISTITRYFPVWIEAENGFTLRAQSEYFAPFGWLFHGRWVYCQQMFKVDKLIRSAGYQVSMEWLTTAGGTTPGARILTLSDNYRGNYRVHSQIPFAQQNAEGQGISTTWTTPSGLHNGGRWYVQYLSFNAVVMTGGENRRYEG